MLEEYSEVQLAEQFERLLSSFVNQEEVPETLRAELMVADQLKRLHVSAESRCLTHLRAQLAQKIQSKQGTRGGAHPVRNRSVIKPRLWAVAAIVILFFLLLVPNTPVLAAIGRWLGYGYLPYAGFIPLSNTVVIEGPVMQSEQGWNVTILQGVREPERTILWVDTNLPVTAFSEAKLVLLNGVQLSVQSVQQNSETVRLIFGSLPNQTVETSLSLPGGWQLPVTWIAANQAGLAPTQVYVPFGNQTSSPCAMIAEEAKICVQAAFTDLQGTHLLIQALQAGSPVPLTWNTKTDWQTITLESTNGRLYPIQQFEQSQTQDPSILSMRFSGVPAEVDIVTLHLPLQVLTMPGHAALPTRVVDLSLRLPDQVPVRSPTPGVVPTEPNRPIVVPTPAINQPASKNIQP
jgi:hypothetical protein